MKNTLVLGIGNPYLSDDGIGARIVEDMEKIMDKTVFDFSWDYICGMDLIHKIQNYQSLIVIDGRIAQYDEPGMIHYFTTYNYCKMAHLNNYHDISFNEMIDLGGRLKFNIPENIHIVAIQIVEDKTFSEELSEPLQNLYNDILLKVVEFTEEQILMTKILKL